MDKRIGNIDLKAAKGMSKNRIITELGKHSKCLQEEYGMNKEDTARFISNLLNLGYALECYFEKERTK